MFIKKKLNVLLLSFLLSSCSQAKSLPAPEGISNVNLNQGVQIIAPPPWNTFRLGDTIDLQIANLSDETIVFDKDFGSRIFFLNNDQWTETKNTLVGIILNGEDIIMKPANNNQNETRGFSVDLNLKGRTISTTIRIYVFGKVINTKEIIGAYTEVVLKP